MKKSENISYFHTQVGLVDSSDLQPWLVPEAVRPFIEWLVIEVRSLLQKLIILHLPHLSFMECFTTCISNTKICQCVPLD